MLNNNIVKAVAFACPLTAGQNALASQTTEADKKYSSHANNTQPNNVYWGNAQLSTVWTSPDFDKMSHASITPVLLKSQHCVGCYTIK